MITVTSHIRYISRLKTYFSKTFNYSFIAVLWSMAAVGILVRKLMDKKFDLMGQRTSRFKNKTVPWMEATKRKEQSSLLEEVKSIDL